MLNQLKPKHKTKDRKRVARGGKRGTYAGRGCKGQKSRSGNNKEPIIRGWIKKYPKLRGYRFNAKPKSYLEVNFDILEENFKAKEKVNPLTLLQKGIISKIKKRVPRVKILGRGKVTKALIINNCDVSKIVKEKIEKAGGSVKENIKAQTQNVKLNAKRASIKQAGKIKKADKAQKVEKTKKVEKVEKTEETETKKEKPKEK